MPKKTENKRTPSKEKIESKKSNNKLRLVVSIIIIFCLIGFLWFFLSPNASASEEKAQIIDIVGTVQISHDGVWKSAENGTYLFESDSVKTGSNSSATIVLFKSSIIRLDSNTEVIIKEILEEEETSITIGQEAGRTWNTISKISGIDNYDVQTPTTVASVRGTTFDVYILADGNITVSVTNGTVNVSNFKDGKIINSIEVPEYLAVTVDTKNIENKPKSEPYKQDEWIIKNQEKDEKFRGDLKEELYKRIEPFLPELRQKYGGPNDEELDALIEGYILGYYHLPKDSPEWAKKLFEII